MTRSARLFRIVGILAASFAGGFASHLCLSGSGRANAQIMLGGGVLQTKGVIRAGSLQLRDKQNNVYAELLLKEGSPTLTMYGKGGKECVTFRVDNTAGATTLHMTDTDKKSQADIEFAVSPDGTPRLKLKDVRGRRAWEAP